MMKRWLPGTLALVAACSGRVMVAPAPTAALLPTTPSGPAAASPSLIMAATPGPAITVAPAHRDSAPADTGHHATAADTTRHSAAGTASHPRPSTDTIRSRSLAAGADTAQDDSALDSLATSAPSPLLPDVPIDNRSSWDLNVADFADQPRVQYYLDYFAGKAHDRFQVWLDRMAPFEGYVRAQFESRQLPGDFVYLALIESGFSPEAVSRASAVGMWQFMVGTGRLYGLRVDSWVDDRRDPLRSTDAAAHHLADLTDHFGSHYLAAAAYNAGAGRIDRGLEHLSIPEADDGDSAASYDDDAFFSLADSRALKAETRNYVPQLIAAAIIGNEPAKYGFTTPHDVTPFSQDAVIVDGGTGLDLIARLADTTLDAMHQLNPALLRMITPPGTSYPVRVPAGTADRVALAYDSLAPSDRHAIVAHQVERGETVAAIARRYHLSADLIRTANRVARSRRLAPGTILYLPVGTTIPAQYLREPDPPHTTRTVTRTVIVRRGEGWESVARRAGVSVSRLRSENHLSPHAPLQAGQRLTVRRRVVVTSRARHTAAITRGPGDRGEIVATR